MLKYVNANFSILKVVLAFYGNADFNALHVLKLAIAFYSVAIIPSFLVPKIIDLLYQPSL